MCKLGQKTKENFVWALPMLSTACMAHELHFHVYGMKSFLRIRVKRNTGENSSILFCYSQICSIQNVVRWDNEHLCSSTPYLSFRKVRGFEHLFWRGAFTEINSYLVYFTIASWCGLAPCDRGQFIAWAAASSCSTKRVGERSALAEGSGAWVQKVGTGDSLRLVTSLFL